MRVVQAGSFGARQICEGRYRKFALFELPSLEIRHTWIVLSAPFTAKSRVSGTPQYLATCARVGCTVPSSSVQRDMMSHSLPSHVHGSAKRVCAIRKEGVRSSAPFQVLPPSVETSTFLTAPAPDQARPLIS